MLNFINKNKIIILIFSITLFLGILTFLTFIDRSFIKLNDSNLQNLAKQLQKLYMHVRLRNDEEYSSINNNKMKQYITAGRNV